VTDPTPGERSSPPHGGRRRAEGKVAFDFGEWKTEVTSSKHPDGTVSMAMIPPTIERTEFTIGTEADTRPLTLRDFQHDHVFAER
jgi:hypothetical protein